MQDDALLTAVFDALDTGVIVLDAERRIVFWNDWVAAASGVSGEAAADRKLDEVFPHASLRRVLAAVNIALESGTSSLVTHTLNPDLLPLKTPAARKLIHDVMVRAIGKRPFQRCAIQIVNVTVAAEREIVLRKRQNARYDAVVDSAPDVILTLDATGVIQLANPAAARQFGYDAQELVGRSAGILFADQDAWNSIRIAVMNGGSVRQPAEIVARRKDGSPSYLEVSVSRWQSDSRVFLTAILRDVNERHNAEEALRASEAQFRSFAQAVPNHVWTSPPTGEPDWFNDRAYEYSGLAQGELNWGLIVHPDDFAHSAERWTAALQTGHTYETEFRLRRADGVYRWHIARALPIRAETGEITRWIGTNTDIEDQKKASQMLANSNATLEQRVTERTGQLMQAEEALRQSQKMEAVGQLTGGIAHDFNNLLQGIIGALDRIQKRIAEGRIGDIDKFLQGAVASANRAAALTHRLLAFSRRQPVDPRPVDIGQLVSTIAELLRRSIGESLEMKIAAEDGLWLVRCDTNQLENALLNLAINARDAMPDGGTLSIAMSNVVLSAPQAFQRELSPGEYVRLSVSDTGVGMPPDVKVRAFDPFYTTKPIGQGTGLGLSMIYGFVRQSDGAIRIESETGKGTTIEICLPRFRGALDDIAVTEQAPDADHMGNDEVVLVVEDDGVVRLLIVEVLNDLGYKALEAADGPSALRILMSAQRIDLLVTDIGLPGLNGRQLADAARTKRPDLKILFMTGYAEIAAGSAFLEPGMEIVTKPVAMEILAKRIRTLIEGSAR
ncbi:MAG TPA: PAS domain S-box protein [Rhizomicrobium sp.]|jgi:PAS domain S-box-containing protein|nr:PAS domain S-box protein [Rhizomicrobium sp.]